MQLDGRRVERRRVLRPGGRLVIEGVGVLTSRDVYTGRVLWKRSFTTDELDTSGMYYNGSYNPDPFYRGRNQSHFPGATSTRFSQPWTSAALSMTAELSRHDTLAMPSKHCRSSTMAPARPRSSP